MRLIVFKYHVGRLTQLLKNLQLFQNPIQTPQHIHPKTPLTPTTFLHYPTPLTSGLSLTFPESPGLLAPHLRSCGFFYLEHLLHQPLYPSLRLLFKI